MFLLSIIMYLSLLIGIGAYRMKSINPEHVIIYAVNHSVPPAIGVLLLSAIVAMIVSTADSFLLISATCIVRDMYQRFFRPPSSPAQTILLLRLAVLVMGIAALMQSWLFPTVLSMALYAYTIYGVGITPLVMAAFFWKRATAAGAMLALVAGTVTILGIQTFGLFPGLPVVYPAIITSLLFFVGGSFFTKPPSQSQWRPFFGQDECRSGFQK